MSQTKPNHVSVKKCLILSQGPVPTPEHTKVEGGGLRCWGLAQGLHANNPELEITVAYHDSYRQPQFTDSYQGIAITTWNISTLAELVSGFDSVVVSYCMGPMSVATAEAVRPDQQLILDCYVPIYVEMSARDSDDLDREYHAFHGEVGRWSQVLARGDVFLCASEAQRKFYKGVLSAVGRLNPATYGKEFIRIVPYGIYRQEPKASERPISKLLGNHKNVKKILWFGGIYPWFDLRNLVSAIKQLNQDLPAKLVIVGAKNPFNSHPDFVRPYEELMEFIEADPELQDLIILQDWVEFEKRADWYLDSDLVVVANKLGEENELAWRTRLVDFMWADLPIITNGGDPLGEELLAHDAAAQLHGLSAKEVAADLHQLLAEPKKLKTIQSNLHQLKKHYYWDVVTQELAQDIATHKKAFDLEHFGTRQIAAGPSSSAVLGKLKRGISKAQMLPAYARKYGMRNTYFAVRTTLGNQFRKVGAGHRTQPGVVMIAHQLDNSGAPFVFVDVARAVVETVGAKNIAFHAFNPSLKETILSLNKLGIKPQLHLSKHIELPLVQGDTIVLNTIDHSPILKNGLFNALEADTARQLIWFIHEDDPEMLLTKQEIKRIKRLLEDDKIILYMAAKKTLEHYRTAFDHTKNIRSQPYKYVIPKQFQKVRKAEDFDKLSFILPGTMGDGRKGQLPIFYALAAFLRDYVEPNPLLYRDFELVYVGVENDFLSRQLLKHAPKLFGERFKHYGRVPHERSFELIMRSNITVCYSLRESLPLFVFEGMAAGHPLLRNDSSGIDEQLFEGKNGWQLDSQDFNQVIETFETVLNKQKTTNRQLAEMSAYSNKVARQQAEHSYEPMVREITKSLAKDQR